MKPAAKECLSTIWALFLALAALGYAHTGNLPAAILMQVLLILHCRLNP